MVHGRHHCVCAQLNRLTYIVFINERFFRYCCCRQRWLETIPGQFVALDYRNYCWIFNALLNFHASFWSLDVLECDQTRGQMNQSLNSTLQHTPLIIMIICSKQTQHHAAFTLPSLFLRNFSFPLATLFSLLFIMLSDAFICKENELHDSIFNYQF